MIDEAVLNRIKELERDVEELVTDDKDEFAPIDAITRFPALIGFWPMSITDSNGDAVDISGNGLHLTNTSTALFNVHSSNVGYAEYDGSADYHSRPDQAEFDITGTESYINSAIRGLTWGCWLYPDTVNSNGVMTKFDSTGNNRSYSLSANSLVQISNTGAVVANSISNSGAVNASAWNFIVGRFTPSTELAVFVNGTKTTTTTSITASIFSGAASFNIGSFGNPAAYFDGRVSLAFLCASAVSDTQIQSFYQSSRVLFGA